MPKKAEIALVSVFVILVTFAFLSNAYGASLNIAVTTSKESYDLGEDIVVLGNLTLDGMPVSDGLVAIQVNDPEGNLFAIRTRPTGTNLTDEWPVEILELTPTDSGGNPTYSFPRGREVGFKVKIKNNELSSCYAMVTINAYYSDGTSFVAFIMWQGSLAGDQTKTTSIWPVLIPGDAATGNATFYANVFNELPRDGGYAYCPEKSANFNITGSTPPTTPPTYPASEEGTFDITFKIWPYGGTLGTYQVYVNSLYEMWPVTNTTTFEAVLIADIDGDGFVTIADVSVAAIAFGSYPGHPNWNPLVDMDGDLWITIADVSIVTINFGKWGKVIP